MSELIDEIILNIKPYITDSMAVINSLIKNTSNNE